MRFNLIIQGFNQLKAVYGEDTMNTIKDNCLFWIYLASANDATLKELSSCLGTYTTESVSIGDSYQVGAGSQKAGSESVSVNTSLTKCSLLLPEEIGKLSSPDRLSIMRGLDSIIVRLPDISTTQGNKW